MHIFGKDLSNEVCVVAEIGVNHEGNLDKALELIGLAADAGADAVKFQTYTTEYFIAADDPERRARVERFRLDETAHERLAAEARVRNVSFFSTPVSHDVVPLLDRLCPVFKIMSGDLTFEPTVRAAARTGKPMLVSTGLGSIEEIDRALGWIADEIGDVSLNDRVILMHCVSAYPTPIEQANLLSIPFLHERYGLTVGYSNHVIGLEAPLAAIALGARVIEVHFTDCKEGRTFRDHALSVDPADLRALTGMAASFAASRGRLGKRPEPCEMGNTAATRKGLIAARDLAAGSVLAVDDMTFARPASEFRADELPNLIGRRLAASIAKGHVIPRSAVIFDGPAK